MNKCIWCKIKKAKYCSQGCVCKHKFTGKPMKRKKPYIYHPKTRQDAIDEVHRWVAKNKKRPKRCSNCRKIKSKIEWLNKDHEYRRVLTDYVALCVKCHIAYDNLHNNRQQGRRIKKIIKNENRKK